MEMTNTNRCRHGGVEGFCKICLVEAMPEDVRREYLTHLALELRPSPDRPLDAVALAREPIHVDRAIAQPIVDTVKSLCRDLAAEPKLPDPPPLGDLEYERALTIMAKAGVNQRTIDALREKRLTDKKMLIEIGRVLTCLDELQRAPDLADPLSHFGSIRPGAGAGVVRADEVDLGLAVRPPDHDADGVLVEGTGDLGGGAGDGGRHVPAVVAGRGAHHLDDGRRLAGALPEPLALDDGETLEAGGDDLVDAAAEAIRIHDGGAAGPARPRHAAADEEGGDADGHEVAEGSGSSPLPSGHEGSVAEWPTPTQLTLRRRAAMRYPVEQFLTVQRTADGAVLETSWLPEAATWLLGPSWKRTPAGRFRAEVKGELRAADLGVLFARVARAMWMDLETRPL